MLDRSREIFYKSYWNKKLKKLTFFNSYSCIIDLFAVLFIASGSICKRNIKIGVNLCVLRTTQYGDLFLTIADQLVRG